MANICQACSDTGDCPTCRGAKVMPRVGPPAGGVYALDIIPCVTCFGIGECPTCRGGRIEAPNAPRFSHLDQPAAVA
jgi:hypothetical protein